MTLDGFCLFDYSITGTRDGSLVRLACCRDARNCVRQPCGWLCSYGTDKKGPGKCIPDGYELLQKWLRLALLLCQWADPI